MMFLSARTPLVAIGAALLWTGGCGSQVADGGATGGSAAQARRPNVLVILVDDLGYGDLSLHESTEIATPNIDSLARDGVCFTNAYAGATICAPSRAALLTGRYPQRYGYVELTGDHRMQVENDVGVPLSEHLLSEDFRAAGYRTGAIGKWHLGANPKYHPLERGFDEFFGFVSTGHPAATKHGRKLLLRNRAVVDIDGDLTEIFTSEAIAFVERHRNEPFFLYLAYNAVHFPYTSPKAFQDAFADVADPNRRGMLAMIAALDHEIGRLLGRIDELGLREDTLVVFASDNGGGATADNRPFGGGKFSMHEGGLRVPMFFRWPARLEAGGVFDEVVSLMDVLPSALSAAGAEPRGTLPIDGVDLLGHLSGAASGPPHPELCFWFHTIGAIRCGDKKLILANKALRLYDVAKDPGELEDLAQAEPELAAELAARLLEWKKVADREAAGRGL